MVCGDAAQAAAGTALAAGAAAGAATAVAAKKDKATLAAEKKAAKKAEKEKAKAEKEKKLQEKAAAKKSGSGVCGCFGAPAVAHTGTAAPAGAAAAGKFSSQALRVPGKSVCINRCAFFLQRVLQSVSSIRLHESISGCRIVCDCSALGGLPVCSWNEPYIFSIRPSHYVRSRLAELR